MEIDIARQQSWARIYVEKLEFWGKNILLLQSTLPISMIMCDSDNKISIIDKIVVTLCNCCESVVLST